ncbi:MAG: metal-binding protein [Firmicutes bacterium]|nr:metal-binding protein [Bacillota bacterium]
MKKATIQLETLSCPSCAQKIENAVKALNGVERESVKVLFNASKVKFDFDEEKVSVADAEKAIAALGFEVKGSQVKN